MAAQDILSILVSEKHLTQEAANAISTESLSSGEQVETIIRKKHAVTEEDFARAHAMSLGIEFVSLAGRALSPDLINYIPEAVARRYTLIPFEFNEKKNELSVAMVDPLDSQVIEFLEKKSAGHGHFQHISFGFITDFKA